MSGYDVTPPPDRLADRVQLRTAFTTEQGDVIRFLIQLEYWLDSEWREVVRYDHDRDAEGGHDITEEGLHRDVFRNGEKYYVEEVTAPIVANEGSDAAEDDLQESAEEYIKRFEKWHGVKDGTDL